MHFALGSLDECTTVGSCWVEMELCMKELFDCGVCKDRMNWNSREVKTRCGLWCYKLALDGGAIRAAQHKI